jgi:hypothetical protein
VKDRKRKRRKAVENTERGQARRFWVRQEGDKKEGYEKIKRKTGRVREEKL